MKILVVQHEPEEGVGVLGEVLARRDVETHFVHTHAGDAVPASLEDVGASALVVLGGGMAVYAADRHAHVRDELRLLEHAVARGAPVLGICFGSQLLARALGARVYAAGREEIGWFDVTLEDSARDDALFESVPRSFAPFHWHGDTFELPAGATLLARSQLTERQAFRFGERAWGIQFHPEVTLAIVTSMLRGDLRSPELLEQTREALPRSSHIGTRIFERFVDVVSPRA